MINDDDGDDGDDDGDGDNYGEPFVHKNILVVFNNISKSQQQILRYSIQTRKR